MMLLVALLSLSWLGTPSVRAQQPPPGVVLPPLPKVPTQPPGPPELLDAPRLPATPIAPPAAVVAPPVASLTPKIVAAKPLTPGKLDPAMLSWTDGTDPGRRVGRVPQVSINPVGAATLAGATDAVTPGQRRGQFESVGLTLSDDGKTVSPAAVSLRFAVEHTGKTAWVQPVDGGLIDGQPGGQFVTVGPGGLIAFAFQPPAEAGLFHVLVRLEEVQSELPFWVLKAKDLLDPRTPVEHALQKVTSTVTATAAPGN